jgi:acetyl-CoA C-acetyltransferase
MADAVIVDVVRTAGGKRNGKLSGWHPADLAGEMLRALMARNDLDPALVDDVIMGCVMQIGAQGVNVARNAVLAAGFPESVPATTVDRQCGSSQQAVHFAAQGVMSGVHDVVVAGGVQQMSQIPIGSASVVGEQFGFPDPFTTSTGWVKRYGVQEISQFRGADLIAERWDISREDMEQYSVSSHLRALTARAEGRFENEIVAFDGLDADEGPREPNWEKMRSLAPLREGGRITAAMASQISDAAAAMLIVSESALAAHRLRPRARIHHMSVRGDDPVLMLTAPIPATRFALERTGLTLDDIDLVEIN